MASNDDHDGMAVSKLLLTKIKSRGMPVVHAGTVQPQRSSATMALRPRLQCRAQCRGSMQHVVPVHHWCMRVWAENREAADTLSLLAEASRKGPSDVASTAAVSFLK